MPCGSAPVPRASSSFVLSLSCLCVAFMTATVPASARFPEVPFVPGELIIDFAPDVIDLPPNPGPRPIPISEVPILLPALRDGLLAVGARDFQAFGFPWRNLPVGPEDTLEYVPARLRSFRNWYVVHFPPDLSLTYLREHVRELPGVRSVGRSPTFELASWPIDTLLVCPGDTCGRNYQWNMENTGGTINGIECTGGFDIGLREAYAIQETCTVKVGLLDTGVDSDHPDLEKNLDSMLGRNFTGAPEDSLDWEDIDGHGTASAGIIAGVHSHDSLGVAGICGTPEPANPVLVPLRIWRGAQQDTASDVNTYMVNALAYISASQADIPIAVIEAALSQRLSEADTLNLSSEDVDAQAAAVWNAYHTGVFLATAAGNREPQNTRGIYPADFIYMVTGVTAVGCDGSKENTIADGARISLSAPGLAEDDNPSGYGTPQIVTTGLGGGFLVADTSLYSGTSAAVPHVGGVAAFLKSHTPSLTNDDIRALLQVTAEDLGSAGYDFEFGHGLVRADAALAALDTLVLVHDSTATIDSYSLVSSCVTQVFRNIEILGGPAIDAVPDTFVVDIYTFQSTVDLSANQNGSFVPFVWTRNRECLSARDVNGTYYGNRQPYWAEVIDVTSTEATIRGYAYKVYGRTTPCVQDSLQGWFPFNPTGMPSMTTKFAFSYLADAGAARGTPPGAETSTRRNRRDLLLTGRGVLLGLPDAEQATVNVDIFDVGGRRIFGTVLSDGRSGLWWDGTDSRGRRLPAGIYFARLTQEGGRAVRKVVLLR